MKLRTIIALLISLSVISIIPATMMNAQPTSTEDVMKMICGTWVNNTYVGNKALPQKIVFKTDRTFDVYNVVTQESPNEKGDFNIVEAWKDSSGCTFCKATTKSFSSANSSFELWKLNTTGTKWESCFSFKKNIYAKEIISLPDSSSTFYYSVYFRNANEVVPQLTDSITMGDHTQYIYATMNGKPLKAYVFQPTEARETKLRPAILFFHGGGWVSGEPEWAFWLAKHFSSLGMVAVAVQYRLSDQLAITPLEGMIDTRNAIRWLRSNAKKLGIDPTRVAVYGWSAGAHLAASAAIFNDAGTQQDTLSTSPNALVLISPGVELEGDRWTQKLLGARADAVSISPASHIRKGLPPTLVLEGRHDTITPLKGVQLFCDRMRAAGNRCELHIYEGVGHLFTPDSISDRGDPRPDPKVQADALKKVEEFLDALGFLK